MINLFHWHATHRLGANGWGSNSTFSKAWFKTISTRTCLFLHFPSSSKLRSISAVRRSLSWCFEPSQPQRMTSGLNTNFILSPGYSFLKSLYHKSFFFSLFIFRGHSTREPASSRVTYFILRAYTGTSVSQSQHRKKSGEVLEKMQVNGLEG